MSDGRTNKWQIPVFVAIAALVILIVVVRLPARREHDPIMVCVVNLRAIGQALHIYAMDNDVLFPRDLASLLDAKLVSKNQFRCPFGAESPANLDEAYLYIPGQGTGDWNSGNVLMYERRGHHPDDRAVVLFGDAHVEMVKGYDNVMKLVKETEERPKAAASRPGTVIGSH